MIEVFYLTNGKRIYTHIEMTFDEMIELFANNRVTKNGRHYFLQPYSVNKFIRLKAA